ncbi:flagellar hook capping FlgD N-terminal domain-containing protein [Aestuariicoccus sp. MJ-SS9]|uniref:flagellar hook capping FlgD N-terminal domain-containing protein n=1 Tax=Aestuariicoccus sp. MJ-SS9 TaxID=3079855 RepID=UPI0029144F37|nr:flagellar hook capping FlgD N-terminal domain-containing protein [Aestuariicoccus sp. MJ-SS9]MDU8910976.1 flagellar hook capping FlgD N-terminal domain-containing protein [Aestuariicoccus sp. MJ-SS9]
MEIAQSPPPTSNAANGGPQTGQSKSAISSDFETFLRMLTVQMQNQDPLNPVDSQDFAVQLATFSTVEQAVVTNDLLRDIGTQLNGNVMQQLAGWVGMEALARGPVRFEGSPITVRPDFADGADRADLVVRNEAGEVMQRIPIDQTEEVVTWAGVDDRGTPLPDGVYRFDVESFAEDTLIESKIAAVYSRIEEARAEGNDILLRLSDGGEVLSDLVGGVRAAQR